MKNENCNRYHLARLVALCMLHLNLFDFFACTVFIFHIHEGKCANVIITNRKTNGKPRSTNYMLRNRCTNLIPYFSIYFALCYVYIVKELWIFFTALLYAACFYRFSFSSSPFFDAVSL